MTTQLDLLRKADEYRNKAMTTRDPLIFDLLLELAADCEERAHSYETIVRPDLHSARRSEQPVAT